MLSPLLNREELALWHELVESAQNILICVHRGPDGDAMGASLGLASYLTQIGKSVHVIAPNAFPDFLRWIDGSENVIEYDSNPERAKRMVAATDLVFCLDFNALSRVDDLGEVLGESPAPKIMLDHHLNPQNFAKITVSHPEMCSTCEVVFRLIWQLDGFEKMSRESAEALYCGMMTDTGGFTYNSNSSDIYFIISQLMMKKIDKDLIYRRVFHNYSEGRIRLMGYVLYEKLYFFSDCPASIFALTYDELKRFNYIKGDSEGLVNIPLSVKGNILSVYLREDTEKNVIRVSLRSVEDFPCNRMAADFFHGGGHLNASGGSLNCSMKEAVEIAKRAVDAYKPLLVETLLKTKCSKEKSHVG